MSNSIWKMPDQKPDLYKILVIKTDKGNAYTNTLFNEKDWNPVLLPDFYGVDDIDKAECITQYAYLNDLITQTDKAERLQKIAERQNDILQDHFATLGYSIGKEVMDMYDEINN